MYIKIIVIDILVSILNYLCVYFVVVEVYLYRKMFIIYSYIYFVLL